MQEKIDYSSWSLEALLAEQKKINKNQMISNGMIGFCFGVFIFSLMVNGFKWIPTLLPVIIIFFASKNSKKTKEDVKQIQLEIDKKNRN